MRADRTSPLHSCLYEGVVSHRRLQPFEHAFSYSVFFVYLDLAELDRVFAGRWCWSTERPAPAWFRRTDHFGDPGVTLDESVRQLVAERTGTRPTGPIRLLTNLRYFGYVINPISLYYCFDETGRTVEACVAEVTNTPWGERHCYVLTDPVRESDGPELWSEKELHVSPFMPMAMRYRWRLSSPEERLAVSIENHDDSGHAFSAGMTLRRRPMTTWQMTRALLRHPCMTGKVAAAIHWQAVRLWWKGARFHSHPRHLAASAIAETSRS